MPENKANDDLEKERLGKLMVKYAVPCVISMLVAALYNIVDQIFMGVGVGSAVGSAVGCSVAVGSGVASSGAGAGLHAVRHSTIASTSSRDRIFLMFGSPFVVVLEIQRYYIKSSSQNQRKMVYSNRKSM